MEMIQDLENGLCELKAPKYWESAAVKFEHLFSGGLKHRRNPLSVNDEKIMEEVVTDEEYDKAKHLPCRELCDVCSYPAISVCGRFHGKWEGEAI